MERLACNAAIISGGTQDMGKGIARRFAGEGARLVNNKHDAGNIIVIRGA